jgi:hypothetical protein
MDISVVIQLQDKVSSKFEKPVLITEITVEELNILYGFHKSNEFQEVEIFEGDFNFLTKSYVTLSKPNFDKYKVFLGVAAIQEY